MVFIRERGWSQFLKVKNNKNIFEVIPLTPGGNYSYFLLIALFFRSPLSKKKSFTSQEKNDILLKIKTKINTYIKKRNSLFLIWILIPT